VRHASHQHDAADDGIQPMLTVKQVAKWLGFTEKGIYSLIEQRKIPHLKISNRVRFSRAEVLEWLQENRVPALEKNR